MDEVGDPWHIAAIGANLVLAFALVAMRDEPVRQAVAILAVVLVVIPTLLALDHHRRRRGPTLSEINKDLERRLRQR